MTIDTVTATPVNRPGQVTAPTSPPSGARRPRRTLWYLLAAVGAAALTLVCAALLGGAATQPVISSLPDAGAVTGWGLPLARMLSDLAAIATIGALLAGAVLAPTPTLRLSPAAERAVRAATWWAAGWMLATTVTMVLTLSEIIGISASKVLADDMVGRYTWMLPQTRAQLVTLLMAGAIAVLARRTTSTAGARLALGVALVALTPTLYTGHSAHTGVPETATTSLVVHVLAATIWIGGLFGLAMYLRGSRADLAPAAARYSVIAGACFCIVAASGLVVGLARLGTSPGIWFSSYGALLALKTTAILVLGALGWRHRRSTLPLLAAGRRRAFLRLAAVELLVMAATVGLAVALSRTPAPLAAEGLTGLDGQVPALTWARLALEWRPDAITIAILVVAVAAYLRAVAHVRARGLRWQRRRMAAFGAAAVLALVALSGGVAAYSRVLLSAQVGQYLLLAVVVPILVTFAAPFTLARLAQGPRTPGTPVPPAPHPLRLVLANPVNALLAMITVTVLLYGTPLLELSLRSSPAHLIANAAVFATGLACFSAVLAVDADRLDGAGHAGAPVRWPARDRTTVLIAALMFLVAFGVVLLTRTELFAASWFLDLELTWTSPVTDQRRAGGLMLGFVLVVGPLLRLAMRSSAGHLAGSPRITS